MNDVTPRYSYWNLGFSHIVQDRIAATVTSCCAPVTEGAAEVYRG